MSKTTKLILLLFSVSLVMFTALTFYTKSYGGKNEQLNTENNITQNEQENPKNNSENIINKVSNVIVDAENSEDNNTIAEEEEVIVGITNKQKYYSELVEEGSKNILVIGEDAEYNNYDTMLIVSISDKNKTISLINVPRDIYIDYNKNIIKALNEADPEYLIKERGTNRINAAHVIGRKTKYREDDGRFKINTKMNFLFDLYEEVFSIKVDDYIRVKTEGFVQIIDLFEGIDIDVPMPMHYEDPEQDLYIHLEQGFQHLDGKQAEGFVRFRQGYNETGELINHGDYFRKENQLKFIKEFFKQHATLGNLDKLPEFVDTIIKNVDTSVKGWTQIVSYSNILRKCIANDYQMKNVYIHGEDTIIDGSSYIKIKTE